MCLYWTSSALMHLSTRDTIGAMSRIQRKVSRQLLQWRPRPPQVWQSQTRVWKWQYFPNLRLGPNGRAGCGLLRRQCGKNRNVPDLSLQLHWPPRVLGHGGAQGGSILSNWPNSNWIIWRLEWILNNQNIFHTDCMIQSVLIDNAIFLVFWLRQEP